LQNNSEDQLVAALQDLQLEPSELSLRPGFGTSGTSVKLRTNFFPIKVPKGPLYEYDVQIEPQVSLKRIKRRIFKLAEMTHDWTSKGLMRCVAHDYSAKLIATRHLSQPLVIKVPFTDEERPVQSKEYIMTIQFVAELETQSLTT
jgi:eukaryotic translation initiation factor 2C